MEGRERFHDGRIRGLSERYFKLRDFFVDRFWAGSPEDTGDRPDISAAERELHDA